MPGISFKIKNTRIESDDWEEICAELLEFLQDITPVDTGLCSESWESQVDDKSAVIFNPTPYASYLDLGWSKQAPDGMTRPAIAWLRERVNGYS